MCGFVGGSIYVYGGVNGGVALTTNAAYSVAGNSWTAKASLPSAAYYGSGCSDGTYCYMAFGTSMRRYDPGGNSWSSMTNVPSAAYEHVMEHLSGVIYLVGGTTDGNSYNGSAGLQVLRKYNVAGDSWSTDTNMPTGRAGVSLRAVSGKLYAIGGISSGAFSNKNEELTP
jgi:N-acetylneuraminic acid mutarotase